jgi:hypothetical protein
VAGVISSLCILIPQQKKKIDDIKDRFYEEVFANIPKYHVKILSGDFNAKVCTEHVFKPMIRILQIEEA